MDLAAATAGDFLAVDGYGRTVSLYLVDKVTATQVVCGEKRFNRATGKRFGSAGRSGWGPSISARIATDSDKLRVRIQSAGRELSNFVVTADNLEAVELLLSSIKKD